MDRYRDASRSIDDRIDDLVQRLTIDEKVAELGGIWVTDLLDAGGIVVDRAKRLLADGIGHVTRIGASTSLRPPESAQLMNDIQRIAVDDTRLGIPVVVHEESTGGFCARDATVFPQAIGLASTWDPDLVEAVAVVIREQMMAVGARHTLAPVLDIARDPRWGRVEETYGEDPVLCGAMGTAYVRGLQTSDLTDGVICTGKHFLGYGLPEGGLNHAPVQLGPRELREVFAEPFAAAIRDAGLASIMNSYSSVDGLPCAGAPAILTALLRDELGFDGVVVADYNAVSLLVTHHHTAADRAGAAAQALEAGLDLELPALECYPELIRLTRDGKLKEASIDRALRRVLRSKFALGLFDRPYVDVERVATAYQRQDQRTLARRAAAQSIVLLQNHGVLPLDRDRLRRVAVVGPLADWVRGLQGDYHYPAHTEVFYESRTDDDPIAPGPYFTEHVTPLAGLRLALEDTVAIEHVCGCGIGDGDNEGIGYAVSIASVADVAVVCVGGESGLTPHSTVGEARDASDLTLTGAQEELVAAVAATGTPTVVIVIGGRVFSLSNVVDRAAALVHAWLPGEETGNALADVLLGAVDASGRLPVTLPRSVGQVPVYASVRQGGGRSMFWNNYTDESVKPLFPFGHGLSYTTFDYSALDVDAGTTESSTTVGVTVTNTGERAGDEVVQLYVTDEVASVARPRRQLIGFARIALDAGATASVTFDVHPSRLAFYDPAMRFVCEPGEFTFAIGRSSADVRLSQRVDVGGPVTEYRQREIVATGATTSFAP